MKAMLQFFLICLTLVVLARPAPAQFDLKSVLPVYPGASVSFLAPQDGSRIAVTTLDDPKAVMIFYRKLLVYDGWQVLSGSVLGGDRTIIFGNNSKRLTMLAGATIGESTQILFAMAE